MKKDLNLDIEGQISRLKKRLDAWDMTLGVAESCTGGLLASWIVSQSGVSSFFKGGVVSYSGQVKETVLNVPRHVLQCMGEVSRPTALYMARGVRQVLQVDWALSITGVAGPQGGSKEKPVGFVCFGICGPGVEKSVARYFAQQLQTEEAQIAEMQRKEIQTQSARHGLEMLLENLYF